MKGAGGQPIVIGGRREFVYRDGRFYSVIGKFTDAEDAPTVVGVWEMCNVTEGEVPAGARPVTIEPGDAKVRSDTGETWQHRAVKAELENATLRVELDSAKREARRARSGIEGRYAAMEAARESNAAAWNALRADLLTLAEQVAAVYGREAELGRVAVQCEGDHGNHPGGADHEYDPELCEPRSATAEELIAFMRETLQLDHPAVRFPRPGPATIANAEVLARTELAKPGGTLADVARAILEMAAEPQRPSIPAK